MKQVAYFVGLDIGQLHDHTAVAVIERHAGPGRPVHHLRHLERLAIGQPYPQQVEHVADLMRDIEAQAFQRYPTAPVRLALDATGVGRAIFDLLKRAVPSPITPITITGGDAVTGSTSGFKVPKRDLVAALLVILQAGRLRVADGMPLTDLLATELQAFRVAISARGHDSYGNDPREAPHDDVVLAVALAAWMAERPGPMTPEQRRALSPW